MSTVARFLTRANGIWNVCHPFTEHIEFSTIDWGLAGAVRREFDHRDPVGTKWLFEALFQIPPRIRCYVDWVMSEATSLRLRHLKDSTGWHLWLPPRTLERPPYLLGKPIRLEESAVGISLRDAGWM